MSDPIHVVKDTVAYCIGRVCELHPEAVIDQAYTGDLLTVGYLVPKRTLFSVFLCVCFHQ